MVAERARIVLPHRGPAHHGGSVYAKQGRVLSRQAAAVESDPAGGGKSAQSGHHAGWKTFRRADASGDARSANAAQPHCLSAELCRRGAKTHWIGKLITLDGHGAAAQGCLDLSARLTRREAAPQG